jgi:hypothetical protein
MSAVANMTLWQPGQAVVLPRHEVIAVERNQQAADVEGTLGWDYVTYGDRSEMLHDMQLWAIRHFLMDSAASLVVDEPDSDLYSQARDFFASWDWPGPGVVTGIGLDEFVQDSTARESVLVRVCERAITRLQQFGEVVPLDYLEVNVNASSPGGVYVAEQPSASFQQAVSRIRGMLAAGHA